jgi:hypothetical protein
LKKWRIGLKTRVFQMFGHVILGLVVGWAPRGACRLSPGAGTSAGGHFRKNRRLSFRARSSKQIS